MRDGLLSDDPALLAAASRDFGDIVRELPALVARPRDASEVAEVVRFARARKLAVAARGAGHSTGGQAQVPGGIVIDMVGLSRIHAIDRAELRVDADAGVRWSALMAELDPLRLAPPVVTDWLELSLGGTISAGGVGAQSFRAGLQTDAIEALTAVTGAGELLECSREREPELFDALRGGLGQFGIITRVRMRLEPAPAALDLDHLVFDDVARFVDACAALMDGDAYGLLAHAVPNRADDLARSLGCAPEQLADGHSDARWLYHLERTRVADDRNPDAGALAREHGAIEAWASRRRWEFSEFVRRVPPIVERDRRVGQASHPRVTLFVGHDRAAALIGETMNGLDFTALGGGPILLIPFRTGPIRSPFVRLPASDRVWLFGILRAATNSDAIVSMTRANVDVWHRGTTLGALRYPVDGLPEPSTRAAWSAHYGEQWDRAVALKRRFDPDHLLAPQLKIFGN